MGGGRTVVYWREEGHGLETIPLVVRNNGTNEINVGPFFIIEGCKRRVFL